MTQQKMMLPLNCATHMHEGYGASSDVACPWCEIERLKSAWQREIDRNNALTSVAHEPSREPQRFKAGDEVRILRGRPEDAPRRNGPVVKVLEVRPPMYVLSGHLGSTYFDEWLEPVNNGAEPRAHQFKTSNPAEACGACGVVQEVAQYGPCKKRNEGGDALEGCELHR